MKKKLSILIALVMVIALFLGAITVSAETSYDTTLRLTSKDADWDSTTDMYGILKFNSRGYEFEYRFRAMGLDDEADYSLIYYADPWAGDNPGVVIAEFTSSRRGTITWTSGSVELGMSLPHEEDANYPEGAKIWLVPTDFLTDGELPLDTWDREAILFERNLITYTDTGPPVRDPNQFDMFVRFGYDSTRLYPSNTLAGDIEAAGTYNDTQYMLYMPAGSIIEGATGLVNWLWLASIDGNILSFAGGDVEFSEPCVLYLNEGGRLYQDRMTGEWLGEGEWVEVGSFTSIVDGEAVLE